LGATEEFISTYGSFPWKTWLESEDAAKWHDETVVYLNALDSQICLVEEEVLRMMDSINAMAKNVPLTENRGQEGRDASQVQEESLHERQKPVQPASAVTDAYIQMVGVFKDSVGWYSISFLGSAPEPASNKEQADQETRAEVPDGSGPEPASNEEQGSLPEPASNEEHTDRGKRAVVPDHSFKGKTPKTQTPKTGNKRKTRGKPGGCRFHGGGTPVGTHQTKARLWHQPEPLDGDSVQKHENRATADDNEVTPNYDAQSPDLSAEEASRQTVRHMDKKTARNQARDRHVTAKTKKRRGRNQGMQAPVRGGKQRVRGADAHTEKMSDTATTMNHETADTAVLGGRVSPEVLEDAALDSLEVAAASVSTDKDERLDPAMAKVPEMLESTGADTATNMATHSIVQASALVQTAVDKDTVQLSEAADTSAGVLVPPAGLEEVASKLAEVTAALVIMDGDKLLDPTRTAGQIAADADTVTNSGVLSNADNNVLVPTVAILLPDTRVGGFGVTIYAVREAVDNTNAPAVAALAANDGGLMPTAAAETDMEGTIPPVMFGKAVSAIVEGPGAHVPAALTGHVADGDKLLDPAGAKVQTGSEANDVNAPGTTSLATGDDAPMLEAAADADAEAPVPLATLAYDVFAITESLGGQESTTPAVSDTDGDQLLDPDRAEIRLVPDIAGVAVLAEPEEGTADGANTSETAAPTAGVDQPQFEAAAEANVEVLMPPALLGGAGYATAEVPRTGDIPGSCVAAGENRAASAAQGIDGDRQRGHSSAGGPACLVHNTQLWGGHSTVKIQHAMGGRLRGDQGQWHDILRLHYFHQNVFLDDVAGDRPLGDLVKIENQCMTGNHNTREDPSATPDSQWARADSLDALGQTRGPWKRSHGAVVYNIELADGNEFMLANGSMSATLGNACVTSPGLPWTFCPQLAQALRDLHMSAEMRITWAPRAAVCGMAGEIRLDLDCILVPERTWAAWPPSAQRSHQANDYMLRLNTTNTNPFLHFMNNWTWKHELKSWMGTGGPLQLVEGWEQEPPLAMRGPTASVAPYLTLYVIWGGKLHGPLRAHPSPRYDVYIKYWPPRRGSTHRCTPSTQSQVQWTLVDR